MNDARLKKQLVHILSNCGFDGLTVDREIRLNYSGDKDEGGNYLTDKEIDVAARFTYGGKVVLLLFECEKSTRTKGFRREYREYARDIKEIEQNPENLRVKGSLDDRFRARHFKDFDEIRVCFVYGEDFPESSYRACLREAARWKFIV